MPNDGDIRADPNTQWPMAYTYESRPCVITSGICYREATGVGVREAAAEIVNKAARTWTWEAGEDEGHAYRNKVCAERRAQWDDDDCPHDGSCDECAVEMHEHFETPASKEHRRELRNLAAKILALPGHAIVQECPGEYSPCEHSSEIVNELGNTIRFRLFAQAGQTRDGDGDGDGDGVPKVVVHAFGPTSKAIHAWTANEARELHRLLSFAFPPLSAATSPVNQDDDAFERAPKHKYWWAGEQGCPSDIKAGNGELRTLRCKICELDNPHDTICHADVHFAALTAEKAK